MESEPVPDGPQTDVSPSRLLLEHGPANLPGQRSRFEPVLGVAHGVGGAAEQKAMNASIVVATYNRAGMLDQCIAALVCQALPANVHWEVLIVDNNSSDGTRDVVARWAARAPIPIRYVFEPRQGKSHALNAGIAQARGAMLAFTDDDVLVPSGWISTTIEALDQWSADIVGGRILPRWDTPPPGWLQASGPFWGPLAINNFPRAHVHGLPYGGPAQVWGANMACRRSVFDRIGGFDATLGPVGDLAYKHEDVELVERALSAGLRVVYDPAVSVFHRVPQARMTWRYICRWHWLYGESRAFQSGVLPGKRHLLGMPGWYCRTAGRLLARWLWRCAWRSPDAAALQLELMESLGSLRGYQKLWLLERRRRRSSCVDCAHER